MKAIISFFFTLILVAFLSAPLAEKVGITPNAAFAITFLLVVAVGVLDAVYPVKFTGVFYTNGLATQVWVKQIKEKFYAAFPHLSRAVDMSEHVNNDIINMADAGVDPEVLINNTTYPISVEEREDGALTFELDTYDTVNTVVRNAEQKELSYNKMESVIKGHRNKLAETCAAKATHAWAPSTDSADTPIIATTGAASTMQSSRKAFQIADIANAQQKFDLAKVPQTGRVMVLHPTHRAELLAQDATLQKAFANLKTGEVFQLFGFDIYVSTLTSRYNKDTGAKIAYSAAAQSTDSVSSQFYHEEEVMKADGTLDMFSSIKDPESRGDTVGFQKRFIGLPIRSKAIGAIYSATT